MAETLRMRWEHATCRATNKIDIFIYLYYHISHIMLLSNSISIAFCYKHLHNDEVRFLNNLKLLSKNIKNEKNKNTEWLTEHLKILENELTPTANM